MFRFRHLSWALVVVGGSALATTPPLPSCGELLASADRAQNAGNVRWAEIERSLDRAAPPSSAEIPALRAQMLRAPLPNAADRLALEKLSTRIEGWIRAAVREETSPNEAELRRIGDPVEFHRSLAAPFGPRVFDRVYLGFGTIGLDEDPLLMVRRHAFAERMKNHGNGHLLTERDWRALREFLWHRLWNPESAVPAQSEADAIADLGLLEPIAAWAGEPRSPNHGEAVRFLLDYCAEAPTSPGTSQPRVLRAVIAGLQNYRRLPARQQNAAVLEAVNRFLGQP